MKRKKKKYNPLKKYAKGGKSTGESIRAGMGSVQEEKSYFKPESFKKAESSESSNPLSKLMGKGKDEGKSKGGSGGGDTEGLLKALGAFSKGGKVDPVKKKEKPDPPEEKDWWDNLKDAAKATMRDPLTNLIPANLVAFGQSMVGDTTPIGTSFFTSEQRDFMGTLVEKAKADGRDYVTYEDYPEAGDVDKQEEIGGYTDPHSQVRTTLGQFKFTEDEDGFNVTDSYDFNDTSQDAHKVSGLKREELEDMSSYDLYEKGKQHYLDKGESEIQAAYHATRYWVAPYKQGENIPVNVRLPKR